MFIEDPAPFNELLRQLNEIEDKINGKQEV